MKREKRTSFREIREAARHCAAEAAWKRAG